MQKKILILWLGAFWFAIAKHLWENNPHQTFYASEVNPEIFSSIQNTRQHPYFFEDSSLPENIVLTENTTDILPEIDLIISVIPCQFVGWAFEKMKESLRQWVTILNLSKWIDNISMQTVSEKLSVVLNDCNYNYAYLAGWMIAAELVDKKPLWADIVTEDWEVGRYLQSIFSSPELDINLKTWSTKNTELYAALKNIIALILWYYEWKWAGASTLGFYFSKLIGEIQELIALLDGDQDIIFTDYALSWDLIATCFGASRNRLLWNMLGEWKDIETALWELRAQKKIAEWYETLKWVYKITLWKDSFEEINTFWEKYL